MKKETTAVQIIKYDDLSENEVIYLKPEDARCEWEIVSTSGSTTYSCKPCKFIAKGRQSKLSFREDITSETDSICGNIGLMVGPGCFARKVN